VQSVVAFGTTLHVAGRDAALLQQSLAPLQGQSALRVSPARASLEDVFISLIDRSQDNFSATSKADA
jgi:ABC-2 type transport system ATP-binding protein